MNTNFYTAIHEQITRHPEKIFIKWATPERPVYYSGRDIYHLVALVVRNLKDKQVRQGDRILLAMPFSIESIATLLGVMSYGAVPVLASPAASQQEVLDLTEKPEIDAVAFQKSGLLSSLLLKLSKTKNVTANLNSYRIYHFEPQPLTGDGEDPALIIYNTTHKGTEFTVRSRAFLQAQFDAFNKHFPQYESQQDFPPSYLTLLHQLTSGRVTSVPEFPEYDVQHFQPEHTTAQLAFEKTEKVSGTVFYFRKILEVLKYNKILLPEVKEVNITGSPVPEYLAQRVKEIFVNATVKIVYDTPAAQPISVRKVEEQRDPSAGYCVGTISPDVEARIEFSEDLTVGKERYAAGIIEVKGKHVVNGRDDEWHITGDYGYFNEKKELFLTGRAGNETLVNGFGHYQLEHVVAHIPGVKHAAAIARDDAFDVYYEGEAEPVQITNALLEFFPANLIRSVQIVESMPVVSQNPGRIRYRTLKAKRSLKPTEELTDPT